MEMMTNELLIKKGDYITLYDNLSFIINKCKKKFYSIDDHTYESLVGRAFMESLKTFNEEKGKFTTIFRLYLENRIKNHLNSYKFRGRNSLVHSLNAPVPTSDIGEEFGDLLQSDFDLEEEVFNKLDIEKLNLVINFLDDELRDVALFRATGYSQDEVAVKLNTHQVRVLRLERRAYDELRFWMEGGMDAIKQYKVLSDLGLSRQEIADKMGVKPDTISRYKQRLLKYNKALNTKAVMDGERNIAYYIGELARYEKKFSGILVKGKDSDEFILDPNKLQEFISEFEDAVRILD